jgi:small subunit ribosomal protein S16
MDSRAPRDGRAIEELGYYHPIEAEGKQVSIDTEKIREWMQKGASISDTVRALLNKESLLQSAQSSEVVSS